MGKSLTSDEVRLELIQDMGEDLGIIFYHLRNRLIECFFLWIDFKYLFVDKEERVELLNNSAPRFFYNVQRIFHDRVVLDLCKLADPAFFRNNENVTYARVMGLVDKQLKEKLDVKDVELKVLISELRHHRNKRIGHNDLYAAEQIHKSELKQIKADTIDKVFTSVQDSFNLIIKFYQGATTPFYFLKENPSSRGLLHVLYDGLENAKLREKRFRNRTYTGEDINRRKLQL